MTGFLGSVRQVEIVTDFIRHFKKEHTTMLLVDPTLGDNGTTYSVCDRQLCEGMRELIQYADIITESDGGMYSDRHALSGKGME